METFFAIIGMLFVFLIILIFLFLSAGELFNYIYNNKIRQYKIFLVNHLNNVDRWFATDSPEISWFARKLSERIRDNGFHPFDLQSDRDEFRKWKSENDKN